MLFGAALLWAWDVRQRRGIIREVFSDAMGMCVMPDGTTVFDVFQEPLRDELDRCSGTVVALSLLAGTPFVRFRSAMPKVLLSGDIADVIGRRGGLSSTVAAKTQEKEEALLENLYGGIGAGSRPGSRRPSSSKSVLLFDDTEHEEELRRRRTEKREELLDAVFASTRARALQESSSTGSGSGSGGGTRNGGRRRRITEGAGEGSEGSPPSFKSSEEGPRGRAAAAAGAAAAAAQPGPVTEGWEDGKRLGTKSAEDMAAADVSLVEARSLDGAVASLTVRLAAPPSVLLLRNRCAPHVRLPATHGDLSCEPAC